MFFDFYFAWNPFDTQEVSYIKKINQLRLVRRHTLRFSIMAFLGWNTAYFSFWSNFPIHSCSLIAHIWKISPQNTMSAVSPFITMVVINEITFSRWAAIHSFLYLVLFNIFKGWDFWPLSGYISFSKDFGLSLHRKQHKKAVLLFSHQSIISKLTTTGFWARL